MASLLFIFVLLSLVTLNSSQSSSPDTPSTGVVINSSPSADPTQTPPLTTPSVTPAQTTLPPPAVDNSTDVLFCTCDLTLNACDVNCCCDSECSAEDLLVFTSCDEALLASSSEVNYCLPKTTLFSANSPYTVYEEGDNLCVQSRSSRAQDYLDPNPYLIDSKQRYDAYPISDYQVFTYSTPTFAINLPTATNYKQDDFIISLNQQNVVTVFMVPGVVPQSTMCLDKAPAKFLRDISVTCTRVLTQPLPSLCRDTGVLSVSSFTNSFRLVTAPSQVLSDSIPLTSLLEAVVISESSAVPTNLDPVTDTCYHVLTKLDYTIYHRAGVLENITVSHITDSFDSHTKSIQQQFSVTYRDVARTSILDVQHSGNPGYLVGEPVVAGIRTESDFIDINLDRQNYLTTLRSTDTGLCVTTNRKSVTFGENAISGCILPEGGNFSSNCSQLISVAMPYLVDSSLGSNVYISSFGNTDQRSVGDWIPLLKGDNPTETSCIGLTMTLDILYAKIGSTLNPQNRIQGASLRFDAHQPTSGSGVSLSSNRFTLMSVVNFVDISESPDTTLTSRVDNSYSFKRAAFNLFYPFIWATSGDSLSQEESIQPTEEPAM